MKFFFLKFEKCFFFNFEDTRSSIAIHQQAIHRRISGNFDELSHHSDWKRIQPRNKYSKRATNE